MKMQNIKIEVLDGKIVFNKPAEISYCTFTSINRFSLKDVELNTFWQRVKWLFTGKI